MRYLLNSSLLKAFLVAFLAVFQLNLLSAQKHYTVKSPDGRISVQIGTAKGKLYYSLSRNDKSILENSRLGFSLKEGNLYDNLKITGIRRAALDETWQQPWGEEVDVRNHYNEILVSVAELKGDKRNFNVRFRAFDDGVGFRYEFPAQKNLSKFTVTDELTEFNFKENHETWSLSHRAEFYEGLWRNNLLNRIDTVAAPLTLRNRNLHMALHEANLTDYASMNLYPVKNSTKLRVHLTPWSNGDKAYLDTPAVTPWRTLILAESAGGLMLSRLMLNLNEPNRIKDTSWIKPGRYIGIWWAMHMKKNTWEMGSTHGATTANTMRYIDFASKHNFAGVLVEGWNLGWEDWKSFEFYKPYPDFDIKKITDYAASKNVKLIGHHETGGNTLKYEKQIDSAFVFYKKYGVDAVKTGYVGGLLDGKEHHGSQYGIRHYRKVIETAANYRIMIDNHEPAMPTGLQRTYPNLMTQEGLRGQEWDAWSKDGGNPPDHTTIIPFTRGLAGPSDFTPGTFNFTNEVLPGTRVHTTLAKQLALSVVIFSPLQMASDMIENYEDNPAFEFITSTPTTWSKTLVPHAKIGEYVTVARRDLNNRDWYVGSITNGDARRLTLKLDFLDRGQTYTAKIFSDGPGADYQSDPYPVKISTKSVRAGDQLELVLARSGGTAIIIKQDKN